MSKKIDEVCAEDRIYSEGVGSRVKIVSDHEKIKILVDPMRRKILRTMREGIENDDGIIRKEMTVPEIARKLGVSAPKCYHHLDLLVANGFVKIAREEKKKRTSITFYERTASSFVLASTIDEVEKKEGTRTNPLIEQINEAFKLNLSKESQNGIQELIDEFTTKAHKYTVKAAQKIKGDVPDDRLERILYFVSNLYASEDKQIQEIRKEIKKFIKLDID